MLKGQQQQQQQQQPLQQPLLPLQESPANKDDALLVWWDVLLVLDLVVAFSKSSSSGSGSGSGSSSTAGDFLHMKAQPARSAAAIAAAAKNS